MQKRTTDPSSNFKFNRVLLKLSGEALAGKNGESFDEALIKNIANEIKQVCDDGVEVAVVVGGGNIIRGANQENMDREKADYMGMLATVINSMSISEIFKNCGLETKVFSAVPMEVVCETYNPTSADDALSAGKIAILGGGTGKPYVTTDTTATLRAKELNCDCVLKATKVDGVYDSDPMKNPDAVRFDKISYDESLERGLKIMDDKAFQMAKENKIPIIVFNMFEQGNIKKVLSGEDVGTVVS